MAQLPEPSVPPENQPPTVSALPTSQGGAQKIALAILLSRICGLVRERIFAHYFGITIYADAFRAASRLPNVLQNLLGEGTLSASFIPVYAGLLEKGKEKEAGRAAGAIFALLVAIAGALALFGALFAPILVAIFYNGFTGAQRELTVICTRIMFLMTGVLVLSAWSLGVLNSHRKFFLPYFAPVLWNAAMIATLLWFGGKERDLESLVIKLSWGAFLGGLLQFAVQVPGVLRVERRLKIRLNLKLDAVRTTFRNAVPAISGRGVVQLSGYIDMAIASNMASGSVAILAAAQTLYMLPVSLFGMSVAAAELPELSRKGDAALDKIAPRLNSGLSQIAVMVVPSVVGYILLGDVVVATIYQSGRFLERDTFLVALALAGYALGLLASTATRLFSSAFFALKDARTPARIAYMRVALAAVLGIAMLIYVRINPEHGMYGPIGLTFATGIAAWLEWAMLRRRLHLHIPGVGLGQKLLMQLFGIALIAALIARGIEFVLPEWDSIIVGLLVLGPYAVIYLLAVHLLGIEARIPLLGRFLPRRKA